MTDQVSSPQIYAKSLALVELWTAKVKLAQGRPFEAREDIYDAALDAINAAAFGFDDELSIIRNSIIHLGVNTPPTTHDNNNDNSTPAKFTRPAVSPEIATIRSCSSFLASQIVSPSPRLTTRYKMLTDFKLRRDLHAKDELIKAQFRKSLDRLEAGDETQHSATDFMVQREYTVSRKEGRVPNFYSGRACDEVCSRLIFSLSLYPPF